VWVNGNEKMALFTAIMNVNVRSLKIDLLGPTTSVTKKECRTPRKHPPFGNLSGQTGESKRMAFSGFWTL
jgi:hypothetical protein